MMRSIKRYILNVKCMRWNTFYYKIESCLIRFDTDTESYYVQYDFYINGYGKRKVYSNSSLISYKERNYFDDMIEDWIKYKSDQVYHPTLGTIHIKSHYTFYVTENDMIRMRKAP